MTSIKTNCKQCTFAKIKTPHLGTREGVQVGCSLGRSDILGVDETNEEGWYNLSRFCNTYRPDEWVNDLEFEEAMNPEETVLEEVFPRMGFFVNLDTSKDTGRNESLDSLRVTLESIANIEDTEAAYVAVITDKVEFNEGIWSLLVELFDDTDAKYHIVQLDTELDSPELTVDQAFTHGQNGWIHVTSDGQVVEKDTASRLHQILNIDLRRLVMIEPYEGINGLTFPSYLFKFLNGNSPKIFQDASSMTGTFVEKVKSADEKTDGEAMIMSWEEFSAS